MIFAALGLLLQRRSEITSHLESEASLTLNTMIGSCAATNVTNTDNDRIQTLISSDQLSSLLRTLVMTYYFLNEATQQGFRN